MTTLTSRALRLYNHNNDPEKMKQVIKACVAREYSVAPWTDLFDGDHGGYRNWLKLSDVEAIAKLPKRERGCAVQKLHDAKYKALCDKWDAFNRKIAADYPYLKSKGLPK